MTNSASTLEMDSSIYWPKLSRGILLKRYKRFLADIKLDDGKLITAHCANSGSMKNCSEPGRPVFVSHHDNPKRKLKYTWELIEMENGLVGVNTGWPNKLVMKGIASGQVKELSHYTNIKPEVKVGAHSRLDILLTNEVDRPCYVEVKNCTMVNDGIASFPDAVTTRGRKHLVELQNLAKDDVRCVMFFLVQRTDANLFKPADNIDVEYGKELRRAHKNGIEILVYDVSIDLEKIGINKPLPFEL